MRPHGHGSGQPLGAGPHRRRRAGGALGARIRCAHARQPRRLAAIHGHRRQHGGKRFLRPAPQGGGLGPRDAAAGRGGGVGHQSVGMRLPRRRGDQSRHGRPAGLRCADRTCGATGSAPGPSSQGRVRLPSCRPVVPARGCSSKDPRRPDLCHRRAPAPPADRPDRPFAMARFRRTAGGLRCPSRLEPPRRDGRLRDSGRRTQAARRGGSGRRFLAGAAGPRRAGRAVGSARRRRVSGCA